MGPGAVTPPPEGIAPGTTFGRYEIRQRLGAGGMGEVYRAKDKTLGREVAIKVLHGPAATQPHRLARFEQEARAASALNHPNIVTIYEIGREGSTPYIAMELVEGKTLRELLADGPMPTRRALKLAVQAAEGLAQAHEAGIVHRDLKPENVMVTRDGRVKILDFGLAKLADPSLGSDESTGSIHFAGTAPGVLLGTVGYMSPEQAQTRPVDFHSDQFSFGSILYEVVTGRLAFRRPSPMQTLTAIIEDEPEPVASLNPSVPPPLRWIVKRCLAKEPEARYASTRDLARELQNVLDHLHEASGTPSGPTPLPPPARRRVSWRAAALAVALAASAVVLTLWAWVQRPRPGARGPEQPPVVAVLPLVNRSGDPSIDYLGVGLADFLITRLAAMPAVTVVSRASTLEHQEAARDTRRIARDLGASFLVNGGIHRSGGRLRVTLELARPDDSVAWGGDFEGTLDDLFDLQPRLATGLGEALKLMLTAADQKRLAKPLTSSPEAFTLYAQGRALLERRDIRGNLARAVELFQAAAQQDPGFALAHAGLGEAYWAQHKQTMDPAWVAKATGAIMEALRLDPDQAEVRVRLAEVYHGTGRSDAAVEELHRAVALQPSSDEAHRLLGEALGDQGHTEQALHELQKAIELRPNYWWNHRALGYLYYRAGRFPEAAAAYRRITELQPDNAWGFQTLGSIYQIIGDDRRALENYERAVMLGPTPYTYSNLGTLHYQAGRFNEAAKAYEQALVLRPNDPVLHRNLGDVKARLGFGEEARAHYRRAVKLADRLLKVNPIDATSMLLRAVCLAKLGRIHEALRDAMAATAISPRDPGTLHGKAVVHALAGQTQQALATLRQARQAGLTSAVIEKDDDLHILRESPEFRKLLE